jgi:hypothetical protein
MVVQGAVTILDVSGRNYYKGQLSNSSVAKLLWRMERTGAMVAYPAFAATTAE